MRERFLFRQFLRALQGLLVALHGQKHHHLVAQASGSDGAEADEAKREKIIRQALEIYPSFGIAASDLQAILIKNGKADRDLLKPYAGKKAPATLNANHMIALLNSGQYSQADSISDFLPDTPDTHMLKIVTATLNGDYNQDNFNAIAATLQTPIFCRESSR